jgi:IMP dehydrogenase
MDFPLSLGFEDVAIKQGFNTLNSRSDVDISSEVIRGIKVKVPLIASNMPTVINKEFYLKLVSLGALGVMHRFDKEQKILEDVRWLRDRCDIVAASIGVSDGAVHFAELLVNHGANILVCDVAHGYSKNVLELLEILRERYPKIKLVAGNTTNINMLSAVDELCDAVKIGIANGSACETKDTAGCFTKSFSSIYDLREEAFRLGMPLIGDGGVSVPSDFTKAIAAGASSIMAGKIFARCPESAAKTEYIDDIPKKVYAGNASRLVQESFFGKIHNNCPEGKTVYLDVGEPVEALINRYSGALRSGITYAGGKDIKSFQKCVEFVRLT